MKSREYDPEMEELIKRYEKSLDEGHPGYFDVEELEDISEFYLNIGKRNESTKAIEIGLKLHPGNSVLLLRKASLYADTGDFKRALHVLDRIPERDDNDVNMLRAEALLHLDRKSEGLQILHDIFLNDNSDDLSRKCLDISSILTESSMFDVAEEYLLYAIQEDKDNVELLEELAYCYEQQANYDKAIRIYDKMLDIDPYMGEAWFNLGQDYFTIEEYDKAIEAYDFALAVSEDDEIARLQKAHALFQAGRYIDAAEAYKDYGKVVESNDNILVYIGESYEKACDYDNAVKYYSEAYEINPQNFDACTGLAICYMEIKEFRQSLSWFDKALRINEEDPEIWVYLAQLLLLMDLKDEAYVSYLRSLSLKKDQADVLEAMGNISFDKGDYQKALGLFKLADFLDPSLPGLDLSFALTYAKLGDAEKSAEYLEKAIESDPDAKSYFDEINYDSDDFVDRPIKKSPKK